MKNATKKKILKTSLTLFFLCLIIALIAIFYGKEIVRLISGLWSGEITQNNLKDIMGSFGIKGVIILGVLSILQVLFIFIPAEPIQVVAGMSYGIGYGLLICVTGVVIGQVILYFVYKLFGKRMTNYIKNNVELNIENIANSGTVSFIVLILYVLPAIPYGMICLLTAMVGVKFWKYLIVTTIGAIPSELTGVLLGKMAIHSSFIISLIVFAVLIVLLIILGIKRKALIDWINRIIIKLRYNYETPTIVQKPNGFIYNLARFIAKLSLHGRVKIKCVTEVPELETPCILLCNHGSFYDFVYVPLTLKKQNPNFVSARLYFYEKKLGKLMKKVGCVPKSMFASDIESTKNCLRVLNNKGILAMMPEARLSTAGEFEDIQPSTIKFIKKQNVSVYTVKISGDYLAKPKWAKNIRGGSVVEVGFKKLYNKGELEHETLEEINEKIEDELYYNEFNWLSEHPEIHYKNKVMAEGLENILYLCPECKSELSIITKGDLIKCEHCGLETHVDDRYGFEENFRFKNFNEWYNYQTDIMKEKINIEENFEISSLVELKLPSIDGSTQLRSAGFGTCTLNKNGLSYVGEIDGKNETLNFSLQKIYRLLFGAGEDFEVYDNKILYYFVPTDKRMCVMWYVASRFLYNKFV